MFKINIEIHVEKLNDETVIFARGQFSAEWQQRFRF